MLRAILLLVSVFVAPAILSAQEPIAGVYPVRLFNQEIDLPLQVEIVPGDTVDVAAEVGIGGVLDVALAEVRRGVTAESNCEKRFSAWDPSYRVDGDQLVLGMTFRGKLYVCGLLEAQVGRETTRVELALVPRVEDGRIRVAMTRFRMRDLGAISKALNIERIVRRKINREIAAFNNDPKATELPEPLRAAGYRWSEVAVRDLDGPALRVGITGSNDQSALVRYVLNRLRAP